MGRKCPCEAEFEVRETAVEHRPTGATGLHMLGVPNRRIIGNLCWAAFCRTGTITANTKLQKSHTCFFASG
jgi:hypothetical protein